MNAPNWLTRQIVEAVHDRQLRQHGGLAGLRDENALEAALARPQQRLAYEPDTDLARLAAAYAFGIARSHPFSDGNKRTSFIALAVFLETNGFVLDAPQPEVVVTWLDLAAGEMEETALADWVRARMAAR